MSKIPGHMLPTYSDESREDALFHYTSGNGLIGIITKGTIWSTSYYCANDEQELNAGQGVLQRLFRAATHELIQAGDRRVGIFQRRGVDIREYADHFEETIRSQALHTLCAYITCFYRPSREEDFHHGLLSQWRGYGTDGGYALQFSRKKLQAAVEATNKANGLNYDLQDVYYSADNPLKDEVVTHSKAFVRAYEKFLDAIAETTDLFDIKLPSPVAGLTGGPLEALLDYLVQTKNKHFIEERECRLSLIQAVSKQNDSLPVDYFSRGGLLVPYTQTPSSFNILDCVEWVLVGPGPRLDARFRSVSHLLRQVGRQNIKVRPSHVPFTRF